jgi:hypothetical protein
VLMSNKVGTQEKLVAAALAKLNKLERAHLFDPARPDSKPTPAQEEVLKDIGQVSYRYVTAGNQGGKSQTGGREISWVFSDTHPYWTRPADWGDEPLVLLCLGLTTRQIEEIMWRKIKSFLNTDEYREVRANNTIQKVVNTKNGNTIIFISMNDPKAAREHVQGFVAHTGWIDEMPPTIELLEEVQRRLQAKRGSLLCTFTPKVKNRKIQLAVDKAVAPYSKRYQFSMFDNPIYTEADKEKIKASLMGHSQAYINCILYGDWMPDDETCYELDYEKMVIAPEGYHPGWRHCAAVDPALKSKLGLSIAAEDPKTNKWYLIRTEYLAGLFDPVIAVKAVEDILAGYNVVRRIYDSEAAWWAGTASHLKTKPYMAVHKKAHRKGEMMKNLQHNLGNKLFIAPWCTDFITELEEMRWAEGDLEKIVGASRFHLHDATNYLNDLLPKPDHTQVRIADLGARLAYEHDQRVAREAKAKSRISKGRITRVWSRKSGFKVV